jgi:hypothetical protein
MQRGKTSAAPVTPNSYPWFCRTEVNRITYRVSNAALVARDKPFLGALWLDGPDLGDRSAIELSQIRQQVFRRFQVDRFKALGELSEHRL